MVDILLLLFVPLFFFNTYYGKKLNANYLSKENTSKLQAVMAFTIVFSHLATDISSGIIIRNSFLYVGYLAVSIFFFISGYGLMTQTKGKESKNYGKSIFFKRVPTLLIEYIIFFIIYYLTFHLSDPIVGSLYSLINGEPIVYHSWYIIEILLVYVVYGFTCLIFKNVKVILIINCLFVTALCICFYFCGYGEYWYLCTISLIVGLLYAYFKKNIDSILLKNQKCNILFIFMSFTAFLLFFAATGILKFKNIDIFALTLTLKVFCSIFFSTFVAFLLTRAELRNPILKFCSNFSLEIYLIHGLWESVIKIYITSNDLLFGFLLLLFSVISSCFVGWIRSLITSALYKPKKADSETRSQDSSLTVDDVKRADNPSSSPK
jgi:peptidoglycan/LPS O-acetylase OafA/YrhL